MHSPFGANRKHNMNYPKPLSKIHFTEEATVICIDRNSISHNELTEGKAYDVVFQDGLSKIRNDNGKMTKTTAYDLSLFTIVEQAIPEVNSFDELMEGEELSDAFWDDVFCPSTQPEIVEPEADDGFTTGVSDGGATPYYDFPDGFSTLADLIDHKDMNFNVGNIFKASYRLGKKKGVDRRYDLRKIIYFAERELKREETYA